MRRSLKLVYGPRRDLLGSSTACHYKRNLFFFLSSHSLVLVAKHHPGDAHTDAEGRQQQHADLWPLVQIGQVVLRDPEVTRGSRTSVNTSRTTTGNNYIHIIIPQGPIGIYNLTS